VGNDFPIHPDPERPRDGTAAARLGKTVRALRKARGWSQAQLAQRLERASGVHYSQSMVAKTETAERPVTLNEAVCLSAIFGHSLELMLAMDQEPELVAEIQRVERLISQLDAQILELQTRRVEAQDEVAYLRSQAEHAATAIDRVKKDKEWQRAYAAWEEAKETGVQPARRDDS